MHIFISIFIVCFNHNYYLCNSKYDKQFTQLPITFPAITSYVFVHKDP